jgi:hypothetical protein
LIRRCGYYSHSLFAEVKNCETPVVVEWIVADIDGVVRIVRFPAGRTPRPENARCRKPCAK